MITVQSLRAVVDLATQKGLFLPWWPVTVAWVVQKDIFSVAGQGQSVFKPEAKLHQS